MEHTLFQERGPAGKQTEARGIKWSKRGTKTEVATCRRWLRHKRRSFAKLKSPANLIILRLKRKIYMITLEIIKWTAEYHTGGNPNSIHSNFMQSVQSKTISHQTWHAVWFNTIVANGGYFILMFHILITSGLNDDDQKCKYIHTIYMIRYKDWMVQLRNSIHDSSIHKEGNALNVNGLDFEFDNLFCTY